jgi:hypothetical protein
VSAWPPPPDESTVWHERIVRDGDEPPTVTDAVRLPDGSEGAMQRPVATRLRVVRLWGSDVAIDGRGRVVCRGPRRSSAAVRYCSDWAVR